MFAFQHENMTPDIMTLAKGLGNGMPIGACLAKGEAATLFAPGNHGSTFGGNPLACAAGLAVTRALLNRDLVARSAQQGAKLRRALVDALAQHPYVGDIRGRGMFQGLEFVADRDTKAPFDPSKGVNKALKTAAFDEGLICYPMGGTIDGASGDHVLLAPPFIIEDGQIDEMVAKLDRAIARVI